MTTTADFYIRIAKEMLSAIEKEIAATVTTPMHAVFGYSSELKKSYDLEHGILDQRYKRHSQPTFPFDSQQKSIQAFLDTNLDNYDTPKFRADQRPPRMTITDLLCWTDDLERLAINGTIQRRANISYTATSIPLDTDLEAPEIRRTQRILAALAVGLAG